MAASTARAARAAAAAKSSATSGEEEIPFRKDVSSLPPPSHATQHARYAALAPSPTSSAGRKNACPPNGAHSSEGAVSGSKRCAPNTRGESAAKSPPPAKKRRAERSAAPSNAPGPVQSTAAPAAATAPREDVSGDTTDLGLFSEL